jgi:hypothetical protein
MLLLKNSRKISSSHSTTQTKNNENFISYRTKPGLRLMGENDSKRGNSPGCLLVQPTTFAITAIILVLSISSPLSLLAYSDSINPGVFSKDSSPYDVPYNEWITRWWQWNMGMSKAEHPRDNYSAEKCTTNQNGSVWFLPDILTGKEERTCTIPAGKAILVPLLTGNCHNDGVPQPMNDQELRTCAMSGNEYGVISATLDGKTLKDLQNYRTQTPYYSITVPQDNIFDNKPGKYRSISDGFFVFLEPLAPGKHDLRLSTSVSNPVDSQYNYAAESLYHLLIEPSSQNQTASTNTTTG